jgi:ABC-type nitrate/sulfonate/bicarbonate transport system permease component
VAAELMGAQSGLGYIMIVRQQYLDTAGIIVVVLIYSVLALTLDLIIRNAEKPFTRWTERHTSKGGALMVGLQA